MKEKYNKWSAIFLLSILVIFVILWLCVNIKCGLLFIGGFSLFMYINITVTCLCNALVGRELPPVNDIFWKVVLILTTVIPICIVLCI